jgi:hypothetical protein
MPEMIQDIIFAFKHLSAFRSNVRVTVCREKPVNVATCRTV